MTPKPLSSGAALSRLLAATAALLLLGCGGGSTPRHASAGRGSHASLDARACGNPTGDLGQRMQTFLQATLALEAELASTDAALHATCAVMARRLGLPGQPARAPGTSRALSLCTIVAEDLRARLAAEATAAATAPPGTPAPAQTTAQSTAQTTAKTPAAAPAPTAPATPAAPAASGPITVRAAPAVCTVPMAIVARAASACGAGEVALLCRGTCRGTCTSDCQGTCAGRCEGRCQSADRAAARPDGACSGLCQGACIGACEGTCDGTCEGTCQSTGESTGSGHVDVVLPRQPRQARSPATPGAPACEVVAELAGSAAAGCTAPAIEVALGPGADTTRLAAVLRSLRDDLPIVLRLRARLAGPLQATLLTWGRVATDLVAAGPGPLRPLGDQASCVFGQIEAAAARLAALQASLAEQLAAAAALETAVRLQRS